MPFCGGSAISRATSRGYEVQPLACNTWDCVDCSPKRQRALKALCQDGAPDTFLTLTVNTARFETKEEAHDQLKHRLIEFVKMARLKWRKKRVEYICVIEATKKGFPHAHVLMRAPFIPQRAISEYFAKHMGSPIIDIRKVHDREKAARYVTKYISKKPARFGDGKRYVRSQAWESPEAKAWRQENVGRHLWHVWDRAAFLVVEHLETYGHKFFECPGGGWISRHQMAAPMAGPS